MKQLLLAVAVLAAAIFAAAATAAAKPNWNTMTLKQRLRVVDHEIAVNRPPVRYWVHHHTRVPASASAAYVKCAALGVRAPGAICVHAQHVVHALHVRQRIQANIAAAQLRAVLARLARIHDFETAAFFADRIWPGTYGWLDSCSSSEGGHGAWVPNRYGSGAGGWMQFMSGTFYGNVDGAFAEATARGYPIPASARSWHSELGQAVTAAWMRYHGKDAGQWTGARC